jgi:hypothetical protein
MASTTPQKKRHLSNLFGAKKSKDKDLSPIGANHDLHPSTSTAGTAPQPDSAYASSNQPSSKRNSVANAHAESSNNADIVPVENTGNIEGVGPERNLAYNTSTGQVVDDDTGQVVVTTTTTTTTTMSTRGGKRNTKVEVHTQKDGQPTLAEAPGDMPSTGSTTSRSPVPPPRAPPSAVGSSSFDSPATYNNGSQLPVAPPRIDPDHYPVPARNPMRDREPMEPVSPLRPNFSYPSRTDIREDPMPAPAPRSTLANLKAAAQGLHVSLIVSHLATSFPLPPRLTPHLGRRRNRPRDPQQRDRHTLPAQQQPKSRSRQRQKPTRPRRREPRNGARQHAAAPLARSAPSATDALARRT